MDCILGGRPSPCVDLSFVGVVWAGAQLFDSFPLSGLQQVLLSQVHISTGDAQCGVVVAAIPCQKKSLPFRPAHGASHFIESVCAGVLTKDPCLNVLAGPRWKAQALSFQCHVTMHSAGNLDIPVILLSKIHGIQPQLGCISSEDNAQVGYACNCTAQKAGLEGCSHKQEPSAELLWSFPGVHYFRIHIYCSCQLLDMWLCEEEFDHRVQVTKFGHAQGIHPLVGRVL